MNVRLPEGAFNEGQNSKGDGIICVWMPADEDGRVGRECPSCKRVFRIAIKYYKALAPHEEVWCVYCGDRKVNSEFDTQHQRERVRLTEEAIQAQLALGVIEGALSTGNYWTKTGRGVPIPFESEPVHLEPLPAIVEQRLERERACRSCGLRYAVFGDHRFCPVCGPLNPLDAAIDALSAERAKVGALAEIPTEAQLPLREQGVFDRLFVDTLGSVVGIVETLGKRRFRDRVPDADAILKKAGGNVFQRLKVTAELYEKHLHTKLQTARGVNWDALLELWAARHVHTHNDGIVDASYLKAVPSSTLTEGQRRTVTEDDARLAISQARALCIAMG